jgi:hypothetical protein
MPRADASVAALPVVARINLILVSAGTPASLAAPWGQTTYYGHLRDASSDSLSLN